MDLTTRAIPFVLVALATACSSPGGGSGAHTGDSGADSGDSGPLTADSGDSGSVTADSGDSGSVGGDSGVPTTDSGDSGDGVDTGNTPPGAVTLGAMSPSPASEFDPISCHVVAAAADAEGDAVSYQVEFIALRSADPFAVPPPDRVPVILQSSPATTSFVGPEWMVSSSLTQFADLVYCRVTTFDADGAQGPTVSADPVLIE